MSRLIKLTNIKRALRVEPDQPVKYVLNGRVSNFRTYKAFNFIDLIDGSTQKHFQVIVKKDVLAKPELGSYLTCEGKIVSSRGNKQSIELSVEKLHHLGRCDPETYPLAQTNLQFTDGWYRRHLHLRPRAAHFSSLMRVRSELELSLHMIMKQMDFIKVTAPILTANDSEANGDLFRVLGTSSTRNISSSKEMSNKDSNEGDRDDSDGIKCDHIGQSLNTNEQEDEKSPTDTGKGELFSRKQVFMSTSAQLHLESLAASLSRVYCLSHKFRAENSQTPRHLCEFLMFEAEEANVTVLETLMDRVESIIKFSAQFLMEVSEHKEDLVSLLKLNSNYETTYDKLANSKYIKMSYREALKVLQGDSRYGCDIAHRHESKLLEHTNNVPIFITNYPKKLKPFYMKESANHEGEVECFDLIAPMGGEICGGSLREDDLSKLTEVRQGNLPEFDWYLDLRRFGTFPHGGFGIGFERLVQSLTGTRNIRDTTPFPRWPGHCAM